MKFHEHEPRERRGHSEISPATLSRVQLLDGTHHRFSGFRLQVRVYP